MSGHSAGLPVSENADVRGDKDPHPWTPWMATARWQQQLVLRYPLFFHALDNPGPYPSNLANLGIRCGIGWYPIIESTASRLERVLRRMWGSRPDALENLIALERVLVDGTKLSKQVYPLLPFCSDVYERGGQLQVSLVCGFLCDAATFKRIRQIIAVAKRQAESTCESCGRPGALRQLYWEHVYCDDCISHTPLTSDMVWPDDFA